MSTKEPFLLSKIPSVEEITNYVIDNLMRNYAVKAREITPYMDTVRFDILGINRNKREIRIIEVKSCRKDFISDRKWKSYLPYCTHFAFAAPKGAIKKDELPKGIGLIEFWHLDDENFFTTLQHQYTKGCSKLKDKIDDDKYISLLEAITMRLIAEHDKHNNYRYVLEKLDDIYSRIVKLNQ